MENTNLKSALVLCKRFGNSLHEALEVSEQLARALDHGDQVTARLLLDMRAAPVKALKTEDRALRELLMSISEPEEQHQLSGLLNGGEGNEGMERALSQQAADNNRCLRQLKEMDRRINQRIAKEKSVYH